MRSSHQTSRVSFTLVRGGTFASSAGVPVAGSKVEAIPYAWPPLPERLALLGAAYAGGAVRVFSPALLDLVRLEAVQEADAPHAAPRLTHVRASPGTSPSLRAPPAPADSF